MLKKFCDFCDSEIPPHGGLEANGKLHASIVDMRGSRMSFVVEPAFGHRTNTTHICRKCVKQAVMDAPDVDTPTDDTPEIAVKG